MNQNFHEILLSRSNSSSSSQEEENRIASSSSSSDLLTTTQMDNQVIGYHIATFEDLRPKKKKKTPSALPYFKYSKYLKPSFPRIVKSDIRRKFPMMLTNVLNSFSMNLMRSFLTTFCNHQDILYQHIVNLPSPRKQLTQATHIIEMSMLHHVINFMGGIQEFTPDMVFMLKNSHVQRRIDCDGSLVVLTMEAHGSRIYPIVPSILAAHIQGNNHFQNLVSNNFEDEPTADGLVAVERFLSNYDVTDPKSLHNCGIPLFKNPVKTIIQSRVILQLDEQHQIHRITLESTVTGPAMTTPSQQL